MSPNERLNCITLERTIQYNTTQRQNSTAKESNATSEIESTLKEIACSRAHMFVTCLTSGVAIFVPLQECGFSSLQLTQGN